jgi:predicted CopG family antitoxin
MTSKNISITEDIYNLLSLLKLEDESFSDTIRRLMKRSDLTGCAGLWSDVSEGELELLADNIGELRNRARESLEG